MEADDGPRGFDDYELRLGDVMRGERATLGKSLLDVQRELKIKATYIAAIENADPSAFETPGFIAGYVRSYARYLELDPDWAFRAFCVESGFATAHGMSDQASAQRTQAPRTGDPLSRPMGVPLRQESWYSRIEPAAVGSVVLLSALVGVIGYGGFAVLKEVQKVQMVPVEQVPEILADVDPLSGASAIDEDEGAGVDVAVADRFDRLYRPQALDVPVMVARDAPISTLDPSDVGTLRVPAEPVRMAGAVAPSTGPHPELPMAGPMPTGEDGMDRALAEAILPPSPNAAGDLPLPQVVADEGAEVAIVAVRPSWVRVRGADGTTIYEKIMQEGDRFVLPRTEVPATLRTGESGAIYFAVGESVYGPAGRPGQVTGNLALDAATLTEAYAVADLAADNALARVVAELAQPIASPPGR